MFDDLKTFVLFVGYPRSGHSIIGALLDAHPQILISHELDVLRLLAAGEDRTAIFYHIARKSQQWNRRQSGYNYSVPELSQGAWRKLEVIGDKRGGETSLQLADSPELLRRLRERVMLPFKIIHVARHPLDTIATIYRFGKRHYSQIDDAVAVYPKFIQGVCSAREQTAPEDFVTVYHEDLLAQPKDFLKGLCEFVGQEADDRYLDRCAGIVWGKAHRSRERVAWTRSAIDRAHRLVRETDYLRRYELPADQWLNLPML